MPLCAANFLPDIAVDWIYGTYLFRVEITPGTAVLPCTLVCRFVLHGLTGRRRHGTLYPVHGTRSLWGPYMSCAAGRYVLWSLQRCCWAVFPDILDLQLFGTALRWLFALVAV